MLGLYLVMGISYNGAQNMDGCVWCQFLNRTVTPGTLLRQRWRADLIKFKSSMLLSTLDFGDPSSISAHDIHFFQDRKFYLADLSPSNMEKYIQLQANRCQGIRFFFFFNPVRYVWEIRSDWKRIGISKTKRAFPKRLLRVSFFRN